MSLTVTITQFTGGVTEYNNTGLRGTANYLIWLCGSYGMQVQAIGGGGGSVTPVNPGFITPNPIEFTVSDTTLIPTGGYQVTIPQFIGFQLMFIRNGNTQYQYDNSGQNTYYKWNSVTGLFQCFGDAVEEEQFGLIPYK